MRTVVPTGDPVAYAWSVPHGSNVYGVASIADTFIAGTTQCLLARVIAVGID